MALLQRLVSIGINAQGATAGAKQASAAFSQAGSAAKTSGQQVGFWRRQSDEAAVSAAGLRRALGGLVAGYLSFRTAQATAKGLIDFEQGLAAVGKTSDLAVAELNRFGHDIINLSTRMPIATKELLELAEAAGQLGVRGRDNLLKFAETVAKMGTATNLRGAEASMVLARILNITDTPIDQVDRLASVFVELGNNFAATESEIAHVTSKLASSLSTFKPAVAEVTALATALAAMDVRPELASSAVGRTMRSIEQQLAQRGKAFQMIGKLVQMPAEEFAKAWDKNAIEGFSIFLASLDKFIDQGGNAAIVLDQIGVGGEEVLRTIPTLANRVDIVNHALRLGRKEWEANVALNKELDRAATTLGGRLRTLGNIIKALTLRWFESNNALADFTYDLGVGIKYLSGMSLEGEKVTERALMLAESIDLLGKVLGTLLALKVGSMLYGWGAGALFLATSFTGKAIPAVIGLTSALGMVAAASGLALAGFSIGETIYEQSIEVQRTMAWLIKKFQEAWVLAKGGAEIAGEAIKSIWFAVFDNISKFIGDWMIKTADGLGVLEDLVAKLPEKFQFTLGGESLREFGQSLKLPPPEREDFLTALERIGRKEQEQLKEIEAAYQHTLQQINLDWEVAQRKREASGKEEQNFWDAVFDNLGENGTSAIDRVGAIVDDATRQFQGLSGAAEEASQNVSNVGEGGTSDKIEEITGDLSALRDELNEFNDLSRQMDEMFKAIEFEIEALEKFEDAGERAHAQLRFMRLANQRFGEGTDEAAAAVNKFVEALDRLDAAKARAQLRTLDKELENEMRLVGIIDDEIRERSEKLTRYQELLARSIGISIDEFERFRDQVKLGEVVEEQVPGITKAIEALDQYEAKIKRIAQLEEAQEFAREMGDAFGDAAVRVAESFDDIGSALEDLLLDIRRMVLQQTIAKPISDFITSNLFQGIQQGGFLGMFGDGAAISSGRVIPFASGTVVDGATPFPMANGDFGIMGERKPGEAIMPLHRIGGQLGVKAQIDTPTRPSVVNMKVVTPDANSFSRSSHQVMGRVKRLMRK